MYYSNKILMPYKETKSFSSEVAEISKKYYNRIGFDVVQDGIINEKNEIFLRSSSRNMLVSNSNQDIVILIDADTIVPEYSILEAIEICTENNVIVKPASSSIYVSSGIEKIVDGILNSEIINLEKEQTTTRYFHTGCSWVMNKNTWDELGGFNESFQWYGYEDLEFNLRASRLFKILFLDYDEYSLSNRKLVNSDKQINKEIYEISYSIFYDENKLNMSLLKGDKESPLPNDLIRKMFKFDNYALE